jgi:hypothetical protein
MSVEGEWGSGKSSFMLMLEAAIEDHYKQFGRKAKIVRFSAWRYDKDEALWAAFALLLTNSLAKQLRFWKRMKAHCILQLQRFDWQKGWFSVARFTVLVLLVLFMTIAIGIHLFKYPTSISLLGNLDEKFPELLLAAAGGAGYLVLIAMLIKKVVDAIGNPFAIDLKKFSGTLSYEERVSFIERFHADFAKILGVYAEGQTVFVFIDDLDRCELPRAADMMQGINLLMSDSCKAIYVLGLDRDKIAAGLAAKYEKLFTYLNDQRTSSQDAPDTTTRSGLDFGFDFLEKFIQIPYQIPKPSNRDIARLFSISDDQSGAPPSTENVDSRILFETKVDSPLVQEIISMVAPSLNHNPRRMKQFVNCFRLGAITASRTGLFGAPRSGDFTALTVEQLGKMVAICLRWPLLIDDALRYPSLLPLLESHASGLGYTTDASRVSMILDYWVGKDKLLALLKYGLIGPTSSNYSIARIDLGRYLQVSPALSPRRDGNSSSDRTRTQNIRIDFSEPSETPVYSVAASQLEGTRPTVDSSAGSAAPTQVVPSISGDQQPNTNTANSAERRTPTGISFAQSAEPTASRQNDTIRQTRAPSEEASEQYRRK